MRVTRLEFRRDLWRPDVVIAGADPGVQFGGGHMASAEREPIMWVWGCAPSGVQGQSPWSGGRSPPEAERFWCCHMSEMALNCYVYELFYGH